VVVLGEPKNENRRGSKMPSKSCVRQPLLRPPACLRPSCAICLDPVLTHAPPTHPRTTSQAATTGLWHWKPRPAARSRAQRGQSHSPQFSTSCPPAFHHHSCLPPPPPTPHQHDDGHQQHTAFVGKQHIAPRPRATAVPATTTRRRRSPRSHGVSQATGRGGKGVLLYRRGLAWRAEARCVSVDEVV